MISKVVTEETVLIYGLPVNEKLTGKDIEYLDQKMTDHFCKLVDDLILEKGKSDIAVSYQSLSFNSKKEFKEFLTEEEFALLVYIRGNGFINTTDSNHTHDVENVDWKKLLEHNIIFPIHGHPNVYTCNPLVMEYLIGRNSQWVFSLYHYPEKDLFANNISPHLIINKFFKEFQIKPVYVQACEIKGLGEKK